MKAQCATILVYNKQGVTDEQLENACRACGIYHFIETLPKGFDTVLDDSIAISAGQKQLLTIARAMIQDNPMLILDEATSSVDTRTELVTQRAMDALTSHRTSFVIAHRLSTIKNADLILVLRDGDIIEQGTHEELLSKGGFYAELYMSQFEKSAWTGQKPAFRLEGGLLPSQVHSSNTASNMAPGIYAQTRRALPSYFTQPFSKSRSGTAVPSASSKQRWASAYS